MTDLSRRRFLAGVGGTAAGAATLGKTAPPVRPAQAGFWKVAGAALGGPVVALDYMMGGLTKQAADSVKNYVGKRYGSRRDFSGYTGAKALQDDIAAEGKKMRIADKKVMTGISNQIEAADNVVYPKAKKAVINAMNAGKSQTKAGEEMQAEIDNYFGGIEGSILQHWQGQIEQIRHMYDQVVAHSDLSATGGGGGGIFGQRCIDERDNTYSWREPYSDQRTLWDQSSDSSSYYRERSVTLLSGDTVTIEEGGCADGGDGNYDLAVNGGKGGNLLPFATNDTDGNRVIVLKPSRFEAALNAVRNRRDQVNNDLSGYVSDVYAAYNEGEIDASDLQDPVTFATEFASENSKYPFRKAATAQLGIETTAADSMTVSSNGETYGTEMYTSAQPTDADGNPIDWQVGETYDPSNFSEPIYQTYTDENGNERMGAVTEPFTIEGATDPDGQQIDSFGNKTTNQQTADASKLKEELERLRENQIKLQEDAQTESTTPSGGGGGGGSSGGDVPSWLTEKYAGVPLYGYIGGGFGGLLLLRSAGGDR